MLDKSVPYFNIIMHRSSGMSLPTATLPTGYRFTAFIEGDELIWSEIETMVGEFDTITDALEYFEQEYMERHLDEVKRRTLFIQSPDGRKVATVTTWWDKRGLDRVASLHWVALKPEFQGRGIGKALIFEGVKRILELEGDVDIYLHTQTWSYRAIGIYLQAGFRFVTKGAINRHSNDFESALPILREKMGARLEHYLRKEECLHEEREPIV